MLRQRIPRICLPLHPPSALLSQKGKMSIDNPNEPLNTFSNEVPLADPGDANKVQVGDAVQWDELPPQTELVPYLQKSSPDLSKYPNVVGTGRLAVTDHPVNIRKRSWMGWFLWGDGTPPPGISPGYPVKEEDPPKYK